MASMFMWWCKKPPTKHSTRNFNFVSRPQPERIHKNAIWVHGLINSSTQRKCSCKRLQNAVQLLHISRCISFRVIMQLVRNSSLSLPFRLSCTFWCSSKFITILRARFFLFAFCWLRKKAKRIKNKFYGAFVGEWSHMCIICRRSKKKCNVLVKFTCETSKDFVNESALKRSHWGWCARSGNRAQIRIWLQEKNIVWTLSVGFAVHIIKRRLVMRGDSQLYAGL